MLFNLPYYTVTILLCSVTSRGVWGGAGIAWANVSTDSFVLSGDKSSMSVQVKGMTSEFCRAILVDAPDRVSTLEALGGSSGCSVVEHRADFCMSFRNL